MKRTENLWIGTRIATELSILWVERTLAGKSGPVVFDLARLVGETITINTREEKSADNKLYGPHLHVRAKAIKGLTVHEPVKAHADSRLMSYPVSCENPWALTMGGVPLLSGYQPDNFLTFIPRTRPRRLHDDGREVRPSRKHGLDKLVPGKRTRFADTSYDFRDIVRRYARAHGIELQIERDPAINGYWLTLL
jgi:hypothetical protein